MKVMKALCLLLLCGSTAIADERAAEGGRVRKVSAIIGSSVTVERGEVRLGKVIDLVFNEGGCIDYLVVDSDDGLVVVPWGVTTYSVERRAVVITHEITRERLREVTFAKDRWPDLYEAKFTQRLQTTWGEKALRPGSRPGGEEKSPEGDKDRKDPPGKDKKDPPVNKDRDTPKDKVEQPKDKVNPPKDKVNPPKDRPRDKPKDKP